MDQAIVISRPSSLGLADYPHIFMPRNATTFSRIGPPLGLQVPVNSTFTLAVDLSNQILIPINQEGWITQLAVFLGTYGNGQTWSLTQSGAPMRDYTSIPFPLGALETPAKRHIRLPAGQTVAITFTNPAAAPGPLSIGYSLYGWYYPARR